jgi:hypothetical protein
LDARKIRENFEGLAKEVKEAEGYKSVQMSRLRDLIGAGRLDDGPVQQIQHNLSAVGLRFTGLTHSGSDWVLVYDASSAMGRLITAAHGTTQDSDERLREAARELARSDAQLRTKEQDELEQLRATIEQIRALVSVPEPD